MIHTQESGNVSPTSVLSFLGPRMSVEEALDRQRHGLSIAFVDARREERWRRAADKVLGAVRLAPDLADETLPLIPRGVTAVVYCDGPRQLSSLKAAELLRYGGYRDIRVLEGGLEAWRSAGGPMEPRSRR